MQFRTTTLMFIIASLTVPLTLAAPAGPACQIAAVAFAAVAWGGMMLTALACERVGTRLFGNIVSLTTGFFLVFLGALGVCYCIALGLAELVPDSLI